MNNLLIIASTAALLMAIAVSAADRNEKTVFVTKASFESNMGGLNGADAKCQAEADDSESIVPSGTYMAWLSDGTDSPDTRFTKSFHPYVLPDGTKIADNYTDLTDGDIQNIINWTKTSGYSHSMLGITNKKSTLWSLHAREKCRRTYRLVCFQQ
jgi:hypothetical protein